MRHRLVLAIRDKDAEPGTVRLSLLEALYHAMSVGGWLSLYVVVGIVAGRETSTPLWLMAFTTFVLATVVVIVSWVRHWRPTAAVAKL